MFRLFRKVSAVSAVALVVSLLVGPIPSSALTTKEKYEPFKDCLNAQTASSWLVLMDTSQSLQKPNVDPEDDRVRVLEELLIAITPKSDSGNDVYLEIWEFGEKVRRAEGLQGKDWQALNNTSLGKFLDVVKGLTTAEHDFHTDYLRALRPANPYNAERNEIATERGVIEVFERQTRPTCQVLVWFSDGELSLEKGYVSHGLAQTFTAGDAEDYDDLVAGDLEEVLGRNEVDLIQELCRWNGPVDQLRGSGRAGLKTGNATYIITVGLGEGDRFGVLQAIAEGETSTEMTTDHDGDLEGLTTCGQKPGLGIFRPAENVGDLDFVFFGISAGTETELCGGESGEDEWCKRVPFRISPAMSYFSILLGRSGSTVEVNLEGPKGTYSLGSARQNYEVDDGTLDVKAPRERSIRASVTSPTAGEWAVLFDAKHPDNKVHFLAEGKLKPRLVSQFAEEGKPPVLGFELATEDVAESLTKDDLEDEHLDLDLDVQVRSAGSDWMDLEEDLAERTNSGVLRYRGDRPLESDDALDCRVRLKAEYEYSPNVDPLELGVAEWGSCEGVGLGADGKIKVDSRATFPTPCEDGQNVQLPGFFDAAASQNVLKHELCFRAGSQGAGEVCYQETVQQTERSVKVKVLTRPDCLTLDNGVDGIFTVEFSVDKRELESHFELNGEDEAFVRLQVEFRSKNNDDTSGSYAVPYEATIKHSTTTERDWLKILRYTLVSLLLPLLLLYAYNYFWGSRFRKTGPLQMADVDVVVRNGQLFPAQGKSSIVTSEDFGPHAGVSSRSRKLQITGEVGQVAELTGRMPKLPHNEPWAEGRFQDGAPRYVLSEQGTSKEATAGRLSPSVAPLWLVGVSIADGKASRLSEDWHARLVVVLPSRGTGKTSEASFEELLPQINRVLDEHNETLHEWQNAATADSDELATDGGPGPGVASPPETQMPQMPGDDSPKPNNFPEIPE
jgi:hypothetical protein